MGKISVYNPLLRKATRQEELHSSPLIEYDRNNIPVFGDENELDEQEMFAIMDDMSKDVSHPDIRAEPHDRSVIMLAGSENRDLNEIYNADRETLRQEENRKPSIVLLDKDNHVRGEIPLDAYLKHTGVDRMVDLIDKGKLSLTYSGLPEAAYYRIEDSMERGREAYAGTINGRTAFGPVILNELTRESFSSSDNLYVLDISRSGEREAARAEEMETYRDIHPMDSAEQAAFESEKEEELNDRRESMYPSYTTDTRGWDDPEYEPDEEERTYF